MPKTTEEIIEYFVDKGFSSEDATEFALRYIAKADFDLDKFYKEVISESFHDYKVPSDLFEARLERVRLSKEINNFKNENPGYLANPALMEIYNNLLERYRAARSLENELDSSKQSPFTEDIAQLLLSSIVTSPLRVTRRSYKIGAAFSGVEGIKEKKLENIYVPSSDYCFIKCIENYYKGEISKKGISPLNISLTRIRTFLLQTSIIKTENGKKKEILISDNMIPRIMTLNAELNKFRQLNSNQKTTVKDKVIYLIPISVNKNIFYHAVLGSKKLSVKYIYSHIEKVMIRDLTDNYFTLPKIKIKNNQDYIWVYDIETSSKEEVKGNRKQVPEGLSFARLNLENGDIDYHEVILGEDCIDLMMQRIVEYNEKDKVIAEQIFAHNGGKFDHLYFKACKNIILLSEHGSTAGIRNLRVKYIHKTKKDRELQKTFVLKDSLAFILSSLKNACRNFKLDEREWKIDLDIKNKDKKWFKENEELWIPYVKRDVSSLCKILYKVELFLRYVGSSVTMVSSISSFAWNYLYWNASYEFKLIKIAKDLTTQEFFRQSCYGGRIIHNKRIYDINQDGGGGLICLDGNSLYPSAMFLGEYPIGRFELMDPEKDTDFYIKNDYLFIAEFKIDANNIKHGIMPYKTPKKAVIYPSGIFKGVYNSVELQEGLNEGYTILKRYRGICWPYKGRIFSTAVEHLYNMRKKCTVSNPSMCLMIKILLNSFYGKMLEAIDTQVSFKYDKEPEGRIISSFALKNGQTQYKTAKIKYSNKPIQIASFILSYARRIMNNLIRQVGIENVWYGDTDSIYVPRSCMKELEMNSELGGFKNDYGDGLYINYALFLDLKRYYMEFNNNTIKAKFLGLNFTQADIISDSYYDEMNLANEKRIQTIKDLFQEMYKTGSAENIDVFQDKFIRCVDNVRINWTQMNFSSNLKKRNNWKGNESFSIGVDPYLPMRDWSDKLMPFPDKEIRKYQVSKYKLTSSVPLYNEKTIAIPMNQIYSTFILHDGEVYIYYDGAFYLYSDFGPSAKAVSVKGIQNKTNLISINIKFEGAMEIDDSDINKILHCVKEQIEFQKRNGKQILEKDDKK